MARFGLCFVLLLVLCGSVSADEIEVSDAWIRQPPPGAPTAAAYMTIRNKGHVSRELTGARSDAAEKVELHRTLIEDGVARMQPVDELQIPVGGEVVLKPGGLHLMLIRPSALKEGDEVEIGLQLDGDEYVAVKVPVRREDTSAPEHEHMHMHP